MKFLTKGLEYNRMAKALDNAFVALNGYESKLNGGYSNDYHEFKQDLMLVAFLCRRDIIERMEEYGWAMGSPISVPMISRGKVTLMFAYEQTIGRLNRFAGQINICEEIQEILEKGTTFDTLKRLTPDKLNFQSALIGKVLMRYRYKAIISMALNGNASIKAETDTSIVVQNSNIFLHITRANDYVNVSFKRYDIIKGWYQKEWDFDKDKEDNEIVSEIFTSFL